MATTSIPASRGTGSGFERFTDATFYRDNIYCYFGNDGDASMRWNATDSVLQLAGTWSLAGVDVKLSDTQQLQVGDGADGTIASISSVVQVEGIWDLASATVTLPVPAVRTVSQAFSYSDMAANSGKSLVSLSDTSLPVGAVVLGTKVAIDKPFDGGAISAAAMTVGVNGDTNAFCGSAIDANQSDLDQGGSPLEAAATFCSAITDVEAEITYTGGVHSDLTAGEATATVYYLATV